MTEKRKEKKSNPDVKVFPLHSADSEHLQCQLLITTEQQYEVCAGPVRFMIREDAGCGITIVMLPVNRLWPSLFRSVCCCSHSRLT